MINEGEKLEKEKDVDPSQKRVNPEQIEIQIVSKKQ
jgi:hypothetical protein